MNEINRIHIAKIPYNIETTAQKRLSEYLSAIRKSLKADDDTMREIELRMTEILADRGVRVEMTVTDDDVDQLQMQLGDPKDFAGDDEMAESTTDQPVKRFMRNTSDAKIAGICSGIASYFGWDVTLVRVVMAILAILTSGAMILAYIIMWIVTPAAQTASDKLEMAGKPITLGALQQVATSDKPRTEPILLKLLRYMLGIGLIFASIVALLIVAGVLGFSSVNWKDLTSIAEPGVVVLLLGLMALGGIALQVFFALWANIVLTKKMTTGKIIAIAVVSVIGVTSFTTGAAASAGNINRFLQKVNQVTEVSLVDSPSLIEGAKTLEIVNDATRVEYRVVSDNYRASYDRNDYLVKSSKVKLTRDGDALKIMATAPSDKDCKKGSLVSCVGMHTRVVIYGPALESINSQGAFVEYVTNGQENLTIDSGQGAMVSLDGSSAINSLTIKGDGPYAVDAEDVKLGVVAVELERGDVDLGTVESLEVRTDSRFCKEKLNIDINQAKTITVNGGQWSESSNSDCVSIDVDDDEDYIYE